MLTNFMRAFLVIIGIFYFTSCAFTSDFVVGTTSAYAPYVSLNEKGEYVGFDIDVANELGKKLGRRVIIKDLGSMPALFLALKQKKIDAIIWAISITAERQKHMEMVYYQGEKVTSLPLVFWKEIPEKVLSLNDLSKNPKAIVAVEAGSFQDSFLQSVPQLKVKQVDKVMDALLEIKYGKSMATMLDPSLISTVKEQFPELKIMDVPLPPSQQSLGNGICIDKKNKALSAEILRAVSELQNEGKIVELEKKWNLGCK